MSASELASVLSCHVPVFQLTNSSPNWQLKTETTRTLNEVDAIIENLEDEEISLEKAEDYYKKANEKILGIEAYLKKAKSIIKKYEQ